MVKGPVALGGIDAIGEDSLKQKRLTISVRLVPRDEPRHLGCPLNLHTSEIPKSIYNERE